MTSFAIRVTQEQSCPRLETVVAAGDGAPEAGCGLGGEEATGLGARRGSKEDPSGRDGSVLSPAGRRGGPPGAWPGLRFRAGLSWVRWALSVQGSVLFFLNSAQLDSGDLAGAVRTAGQPCTCHPSPEGGKKPASPGRGAAAGWGHAAGV